MVARKGTQAGTAGKSILTKSVIWSFAGQGVPLVVAILAIPLLVGGYGTDRFGILALVLAAFGYFTLFDLGMSRALTQWIAGASARSSDADLGGAIWAGLALMGVFGALGGGLLIGLTPWLVTSALVMPDALVGEARISFFLVAVSIPFLTVSQALRGVLEAHLKFEIVNAVRIPLSCLSLLGPLFLLLFTNSLVPAVAVIVLCRVAGGAIYLRYCLDVQPEMRRQSRIDLGALLPLVRFGSWMTVSNVVGPLMVYFDRFLIGSVISVAATAYYAAPYDMVTRLWIVPGAFCAVLFPAFAASAKSDPPRLVRLYVRGLKYTFVSLFPLVFVTVVFAPDLLALWLGADFARESATALRILALGVLVNSLAQVPFALVQGIGRADITAKFHLAQAPFYLLLLWWGVERFGIEGAAMAWSVRVSVDAALLLFVSTRLADCPAKPLVLVGLALAGGCLLALAVAFTASFNARLVLSGTVLGLFLMLAWFIVLSGEDRRLLNIRRVMK